MSNFDLIINVTTALLLGGLIGAERQWRQRLAGLRTNTLVCVGSALFVSVSGLINDEISPTRIAAQVVSGIGFLGTGVIFKEGVNVKGLNTAATLWCSAAVGVLAGSGFALAAALGTVAVLIPNMIMRYLGYKINSLSTDYIETDTMYRVCVTCAADTESHIRNLLMTTANLKSLSICGLYSEDLPGNLRSQVWADLKVVGRNNIQMELFINRIGLEPGVSAVSWHIIESEGSECSCSNMHGSSVINFE